jgi:hypothetical protein
MFADHVKPDLHVKQRERAIIAVGISVLFDRSSTAK